MVAEPPKLPSELPQGSSTPHRALPPAPIPPPPRVRGWGPFEVPAFSCQPAPPDLGGPALSVPRGPGLPRPRVLQTGTGGHRGCNPGGLGGVGAGARGPRAARRGAPPSSRTHLPSGRRPGVGGADPRDGVGGGGADTCGGARGDGKSESGRRLTGRRLRSADGRAGRAAPGAPGPRPRPAPRAASSRRRLRVVSVVGGRARTVSSALRAGSLGARGAPSSRGGTPARVLVFGDGALGRPVSPATPHTAGPRHWPAEQRASGPCAPFWEGRPRTGPPGGSSQQGSGAQGTCDADCWVSASCPPFGTRAPWPSSCPGQGPPCPGTGYELRGLGRRWRLRRVRGRGHLSLRSSAVSPSGGQDKRPLCFPQRLHPNPCSLVAWGSWGH